MRAPIKVVEKGWGKEVWFANSPLYCYKHLEVEYGKRCSLHYHEKKVETFVMIHGQVKLELEGVNYNLRKGVVIDIFPYQEHRFTGITTLAVIAEVSTQHFESDSVRIEKGD